MNHSEDFVIENGVLTEYRGADEDVIISEGVSGIGKKAFFRCKTMKSVIIPNGTVFIENSAFSCCPALSTVSIPNTVTSIGNNAFRYCKSITEIVLPDSLTFIGESAFRKCKSLKKINIPKNVTEIGYAAFYECGTKLEIKMDSEHNCCSHPVFSEYSDITVVYCSANHPAQLMTCGGGGYIRYYFPDILLSSIPEHMKYRAAMGFIDYYNEKAMSSEIKEEYFTYIKMNWKAISNYVLSHPLILRPALNSRVIPLKDARMLIGTSDDIEFTALLLNYCDTASKTEKAALVRSEAIKTEKAFGIRPLTVAEYKKAYVFSDYDGGYIIKKCKINLISVEIPKSIGRKPVVAIGKMAFADYHMLTSIIIPNTVRKIHAGAFKGCTSLKHVIIAS